MKAPGIMALVAVFGVTLGLATSSASADNDGIGSVYTMTNAPDANAVLQYDRLADGSLEFRAMHMTGGRGSGDGLGNQGGVVLSDDGRWLLVVNAGSDEVSVFATGPGGLALTDVEESGGVRPVSVAIHRGLVYVVHAGGAAGDVDSVSALHLDNHGGLTPLPGSSASLSGANTAPAQIGFSPDGRSVVVTEKATNTISVFQIDADGLADTAVFNPSEGVTPFSFAFGKRGQLFVSEAFGGAEDAGAVSSYSLLGDGVLDTIAASVPNTETAPCWLVVSRGGRYAFTTNTPDDSLSAYAIAPDGQITLVDADGRTGEPGAGTMPLDMDLSRDGRHLYTLNVGDGSISTFRVGSDGSLTQTSALGGVPGGVNGLAAR